MRPKRHRTQRKPLEIDHTRNKRFDLKEKKKILAALKLHGADIDAIAETVPKRTKEEVKNFLEATSRRAKSENLPLYDLYKKTPIELWLQMAEDLINNGTDYSKEIGHSLSIISSCEDHMPRISNRVPNYEALYYYLSCITNGYAPPKLTSLDSSIMVELIQDLAHQLSNRDTALQRRLMEEKYRLLTRCLHHRGRGEASQAIQQALHEDLVADNNTSSNLSQLADSDETPDIPTRSSPQPGTSSGITRNQQASRSDASDSPSDQTSSNPQPSTSSGRTRKPRASHSTASGSSSGLKRDRPKRTSLFSLNPFCIPIRYMNPELKEGWEKSVYPELRTHKIYQRFEERMKKKRGVRFENVDEKSPKKEAGVTQEEEGGKEEGVGREVAMEIDPMESVDVDATLEQEPFIKQERGEESDEHRSQMETLSEVAEGYCETTGGESDENTEESCGESILVTDEHGCEVGTL